MPRVHFEKGILKLVLSLIVPVFYMASMNLKDA